MEGEVSAVRRNGEIVTRQWPMGEERILFVITAHLLIR